LTSRSADESITALSGFGTIQVGDRIGPYEIIAPFATGGMAQLFIARTVSVANIEHFVALKAILPQHAAQPTAVAMFFDEAKVTGTMTHTNIVKIFDFGEVSGRHYIAMEYVHGIDLRTLLQRVTTSNRDFSFEYGVHIVRCVAAALEHAHTRTDSRGRPMKIVHRDVSPANVLLAYDGAIKLVDFGIAKAEARSLETVSGIIKGKAAYMSPEQCRGRKLDHRSDVFALGILLYETTTGHRCFRADNDYDTMQRISTANYIRPSLQIAEYPPALEAIIAKALVVDVAQRYQSAGALLADLEQIALPNRLSLVKLLRELYGDVPEPWTGHGPPAAAPQPALDFDNHPTAQRQRQTTHDVVTSDIVLRDVIVTASTLNDLAVGDATNTDEMPAPLDLGTEPTVLPDRHNVLRELVRKADKAERNQPRMQTVAGHVPAKRGSARRTFEPPAATMAEPTTPEPPSIEPALATASPEQDAAVSQSELRPAIASLPGVRITQSYFLRRTGNNGPLAKPPVRVRHTGRWIAAALVLIGSAVLAWQLL
jgi:serine/threonine protein kinase